MKYCTHCGKEIHDEAVICTGCGCAVNEIKTKKSSNGLNSAISIFMIIGTIFSAFLYLIPLAWCIPMTISVNSKINNNEKIGTGLKVCTLLFVNMIAGILLLCRNEDSYN